jgi:hypothetical protein
MTSSSAAPPDGGAVAVDRAAVNRPCDGGRPLRQYQENDGDRAGYHLRTAPGDPSTVALPSHRLISRTLCQKERPSCLILPNRLPVSTGRV